LLETIAAKLSPNPLVHANQLTPESRKAVVGEPSHKRQVEFDDYLHQANAPIPAGNLPDLLLGVFHAFGCDPEFTVQQQPMAEEFAVPRPERPRYCRDSPEIHGDRVSRVAPLGFDAHDFVGEWGNLPWDEAASWSDAAHLGRIQEYHNKLRDADGYFVGEFGEVQVCDPQQKIWQVEYNRAGEDDSIYFLVERKDKWTFVVKDIGDEKLDGCKDVEREPRRPSLTMFAKLLEW
jgi:hypothetical protein